VSTDEKTQPEARDDCQSMGGDLVSVEDDAEMKYIASISYVLQPFTSLRYLALYAIISVAQPLWVSWVSGHPQKLRLWVSDTPKKLKGNITPSSQ